jgi:GAF domain-containing protein
VFGVTISVLGDFISHIPWYLWPLQEGADWRILFLHHPFFIMSQLLVPLSIGVSISRFGLWEIDFIINQTLIYGLLMTLVAAGWATIAKILELLFGEALGESAAPLATGLAVLVVGLAFGTTRKYLETLVNHHFFPNKVNPSRDFVEFLPEARSTIGSSELLEILLCRTLERFKITHGVVLLGNIEDKQPQLVSVSNIEPETVESLEWGDQVLSQIYQGSVMRQPDDRVFPLLVPLVLRRTKQLELLGVLALGPLQNGRQYSLNELWMFKQLASQAGTAIYISQLNAANYQKLKQKIHMLEQRITFLSEEITQGGA